MKTKSALFALAIALVASFGFKKADLTNNTQTTQVSRPMFDPPNVRLVVGPSVPGPVYVLVVAAFTDIPLSDVIPATTLDTVKFSLLPTTQYQVKVITNSGETYYSAAEYAPDWVAPSYYYARTHRAEIPTGSSAIIISSPLFLNVYPWE